MFREILNDPVMMIMIGIVAFGFIRAFIYQFNVRKNGYETETMVDYISEESHNDSNGHHIYYDYHVSYRDRKGIYRQGVLSNPVFDVKEGDIIIIRYVDDTPEAPVYIRKAER